MEQDAPHFERWCKLGNTMNETDSVKRCTEIWRLKAAESVNKRTIVTDGRDVCGNFEN